MMDRNAYIRSRFLRPRTVDVGGCVAPLPGVGKEIQMKDDEVVAGGIITEIYTRLKYPL